MNTTCKIVYIKEKYFIDNKHFVEMLDPTNADKQSKRNYIFLNFLYNGNNIFVPLRTEIEPYKPYGIIGYAVPTQSKPKAGLDFRKILIVNNLTYIDFPQNCRIPHAQQKIINAKYKSIEKQVIGYIDGYIKSALKQREKIDKKFVFSTLHNFHIELGISNLKTELKDNNTLGETAATKSDSTDGQA